MPIKIIKNTVLFPIIFGIIFNAISCAKKTKSQEIYDKKLITEDNKLKPKDTLTLHSTSSQNTNTISVGADHTKTYLPLLRGKRVGIVANQTSVLTLPIQSVLEHNKTTKTNYHLVDYLHSKKSISVRKVFSPEHGFRGKADAGELVEDGKDKKTGLPIFSLHGKHKKPSNAQLKDLDIVVFDIQDVGVRFYTYISTLHYVMEACAEQKIPLLILDRPNPNGSYVDGPVLKKEHSSFLGMHTIPLVHGMTIGEYAQMINGENWLKDGIQCKLTVIKNQNYSHDSFYSLPIRPSPNLPNDKAITLYPSLGLLEGTNINAGRGTEFQFQRYGAPFLDSTHYSFSYIPKPNFGSKYPKHDGKICYGEDLSVIKAKKKFTLKYIIEIYKNTLDKSKVFNTNNFTKHAGTEQLQKQIEAGLSETEIRKTWNKDIEDYKKIREKYLIYN